VVAVVEVCKHLLNIGLKQHIEACQPVCPVHFAMLPVRAARCGWAWKFSQQARDCVTKSLPSGTVFEHRAWHSARAHARVQTHAATVSLSALVASALPRACAAAQAGLALQSINRCTWAPCPNTLSPPGSRPACVPSHLSAPGTAL